MCIPFEEEPCPVSACLSMKCIGGTDSDQILTRAELMMTITLLGWFHFQKTFVQSFSVSVFNIMSLSEVTSSISSDHGDMSTENHDRSHKTIDPGDFVTYEDYVDAFICSEDIRYLQVKGGSSMNILWKSFPINGQMNKIQVPKPQYYQVNSIIYINPMSSASLVPKHNQWNNFF